MKVMSIIGIVLFSLMFICMVTYQDSEPDAAIGAGYIGLLFALPLAIVGLVKSNKKV
jgi:hypothetical protein